MPIDENSRGRWEFDENGQIHYVPPKGGSQGSGERFQDQLHRDLERDFNRDFGDFRADFDQARREFQNTRSQRTPKRKDTSWHWVLIILGFIAFWPVGLVLLFLEIFDKWPGNDQVQQELNRAAKAAGNVARSAVAQGQQKQQEARARQAAEKANKEQQRQEKVSQERQAAASRKSKKAAAAEDKAHGFGGIKVLRGIGLGMTGLFGFAFIMELVDQIDNLLYYDWSMIHAMQELIPLLAFFLIGLTLLAVAGRRKRKLSRFKKYVNIVGDRVTIPIRTLADSMGCSEKRVVDDLEEMLDRNYLEGAYVDMAHQCLVMPGGFIVDAPPAEESAPDASDTPEDDSTLRRIREVNDAIANPELSKKIYRIEELTEKIFKLLKERPEKASELRSFMNYYLPQTLKILEMYSRLEAQGIEGENIGEAKQRIETMMDKVVDGYESQLDKLFAEDVMDISADIRVMEQMLEKDGLTMDNELKL